MKGNMYLWRGQAVVDVLSYIMLLLLMSWAVSRFCCWCLELYQVSVADVLSCISVCCWCLSCIVLLLLMSRAVSWFCCWCFELCRFAIVVSSILFRFFQSLNWNKQINLSLGFRVGKFCDGGPRDIVYDFIIPNFFFT